MIRADSSNWRLPASIGCVPPSKRLTSRRLALVRTRGATGLERDFQSPAPGARVAGIAGSNHGPAITEIDAPHLRGRRRLNRRANLILSQSPSIDGNAWEFTGNRCGNTVGIWELDRLSLRSMASGDDRPFVEPPHPDITCRTPTRNAAGADASASGDISLRCQNRHSPINQVASVETAA